MNIYVCTHRKKSGDQCGESNASRSGSWPIQVELQKPRLTHGLKPKQRVQISVREAVGVVKHKHGIQREVFLQVYFRKKINHQKFACVNFRRTENLVAHISAFTGISRNADSGFTS